MSANVKVFGCRPMTDGTASTAVWGRRSKTSKGGNRGRGYGGGAGSHSLGPVATTVCSLAPVENTTASPSGTDRTASLGAAVEQHGRQRSWPLVSRPEQSPLCGALQCSLQIARSPILVRNALAQLLEPPYTDPYVRWCGRGGAERLPPIPIIGTFETCRRTMRMSVHRGRPEAAGPQSKRRFVDPKRT